MEFNLNDLLLKKLKQKAAYEVAEEDINKEFEKPLWKKLGRDIGLATIPVAIAGLFGSNSGLEASIDNATALGSMLYPLSIVGRGISEIARKKSPDFLRKYTLVQAREYYSMAKSNFKDNPLAYATRAAFRGFVFIGAATIAKALNFTDDFSTMTMFYTGVASSSINEIISYVKRNKIRTRMNKNIQNTLKDFEINQEQYRREQARKIEEELKRMMDEIFGRNSDFKGNPYTNGGRYSPIRIKEELSYSQATKILGVSPSSDYEESKKAYRKLAKKYHPDMNKSKSAESKFKEISSAWAVIEEYHKSR
jgi:hypothetical protein